MFSVSLFSIFMMFFSMILQWTDGSHDSLARILYTLTATIGPDLGLIRLRLFVDLRVSVFECFVSPKNFITFYYLNSDLDS